MNVTMISMPWNLLDTPSLPIGILKAVLAGSGRHHAVREVYGNIRWAEYLLEVTGGDLTPRDYDYVANIGAWYGMGDWIFTPGLYGQPGWRRKEYLGYLA